MSSSFCVAFTTASFANLGVGTSHLPSESTVVVFLVPSGNVTSIVAPTTPVPVTFSSSVSTLSITGVAEVSLSTTVFSAGILASDLSENVTFTSPLSATSIVVPAGSVGFAFSTSAFTFAFSSVVN